MALASGSSTSTDTDTNPVSVDTDRLIKLGNNLQTWSKDIVDAQGKSLTLKITPGMLATPKNIQNQFTNVGVKDLQDGLSKFGGVMYAIGAELIKIAAVYQTTEDINKDDANRIQDLVNAVTKYYPNASVVMPTSGGNVPNTGTGGSGQNPPGGTSNSKPSSPTDDKPPDEKAQPTKLPDNPT